jgi:hypothetical protein
MQRIDDLGGKAELTVREPPKREGSYEPSSQGRFIRNLYSRLIGTYNLERAAPTMTREIRLIMMTPTGTPG